MRFARLLSVPVAAVAACALAAPAHAAGDGIITDYLGSVVLSVTPTVSTSLSANCTYTRTSAGLGGGPVSFDVVAEATALGTYKGVEIVATAVRCRVFKPERVIDTQEQWYPGQAAVASATASSYNAKVDALCVQVLAILRHVPIGESDNLISDEHCVY